MGDIAKTVRISTLYNQCRRVKPPSAFWEQASETPYLLRESPLFGFSAMKLEHLFLLVIALVSVLLLTVFRPAWSPGVIESERPGVLNLDDETHDWLRS